MNLTFVVTTGYSRPQSLELHPYYNTTIYTAVPLHAILRFLFTTGECQLRLHVALPFPTTPLLESSDS